MHSRLSARRISANQLIPKEKCKRKLGQIISASIVSEWMDYSQLPFRILYHNSMESKEVKGAVQHPEFSSNCEMNTSGKCAYNVLFCGTQAHVIEVLMTT
ncbi:hypothetical protein EGR_06916 [Echinococcus granulosus]|uniref:Uncharacterized protein n=1 Tax=Echinococcus granulosus TaxID=6210 RepID=W6UJ38_ECHGR|nr:hypothetical protein EGR_06916 [Echinococcus granulosus]EUB58172.1 hypothetical protein EGR_06916 [Echinococcus granulosus]